MYSCKFFRKLFDFFSFFFEWKLSEFFRAGYDGNSRHQCNHSINLVNLAQGFSLILFNVGDNDAKTQKFVQFLQKHFKEAVWSSKVKFAGNIRLDDLYLVLVAKK